MSRHPLVNLRWYERLLLKFLSRSPRIERITIEQVVHDPSRRDKASALDYTAYLESLYKAPSASDTRHG